MSILDDGADETERAEGIKRQEIKKTKHLSKYLPAYILYSFNFYIDMFI